MGIACTTSFDIPHFEDTDFVGHLSTSCAALWAVSLLPQLREATNEIALEVEPAAASIPACRYSHLNA